MPSQAKVFLLDEKPITGPLAVSLAVTGSGVLIAPVVVTRLSRSILSLPRYISRPVIKPIIILRYIGIFNIYF